MTKDRKRSTIYVSETVDARVLEVIGQYSFGRDTEVKVVPACECGGVTDVEALKATLAEDNVSCLLPDAVS